MKKKKLIAGLLAMAVSVPMFAFNVSATDYITLYVATDGSDSGTGAIDSPFATIERARDEIRNIKTTSGLPNGGACVYVRGGVYKIFDTIELTSDDSGTENAPVTYRAYPGEKVELIGGVNFEPESFKEVTDKAVLDKLIDQSVTGKLVEVDLAALGLTDIPETQSYGAYQGGVDAEDKGSTAPSMEFFVDGKPQQIGRWPNEGYETYEADDVLVFNATYYTAKRDPEKYKNNPKWSFTEPFQIKYTNPRAEVWAKSPTAKLYGYWDVDWADYTLKIRSYEPGKLSLGRNRFKPSGTRRFYAYDMLEEIDIPGEYFIDTVAKKLYWYPVEGYETAEMALSVMNDPMFNVSGSYINLKELGMGYVRKGLIEISGDYNTVSHCELYFTGSKSIIVTGNYNGIVSNYIHDVDGGIRLGGGNQAALIKAENYAENNYIKDFARITLTYCDAINPIGIGNRATNNTMTGSTHQAMEVSGPEHIVEYNDIFGILTESDDAGAIYSGRHKWHYGNIVRFNYIHDMGSNSGGSQGIIGLYFDDGRDAQHVYGNVFANYSGVGIQATGSDSTYENNLAYNIGGQVVRGVDWSTRREDTDFGRKGLIEGGDGHFAVTEQVWLDKYPQIAKKLDMPNMFLPENNIVRSNLAIKAADHKKPDPWLDPANGNQIESAVMGTDSDIEITEDGIKTINSNPVYQQLGEDFPQIDTSLTGVYDKNLKEKFEGRIVLGINKGGALVDSNLKLIDEGNTLVMPVIVNDRTMVPIRFISENLGAKVDWNEAERKVTISSEGKTIELVIGEAKITINGEVKEIDAPANISDGRTFVPLRVISENLDRSIHWDPKGLIVISGADDEFKADEFPVDYEARLINEALRQIDLR